MDCNSTTLIGKDCESRSLIEKINKFKSFYCKNILEFNTAIASSCIEFPSDEEESPAEEGGFICSLIETIQEEVEKEIKLVSVDIIDQSIITKLELLQDDLCSLEELVSIFKTDLKAHCDSLIE